MTLRLDTIAPELAEQLAQAEATVQRQVAVAAAEHAIERTQLTAPEIDDARAAIRAGTFGESAAMEAARGLTERLDEEQWDIQDRVDSGQATSAEHLAAFSKARASSAICFALDADPHKAAVEALYEANAAVDDLMALRDLVSRNISG